MIEITKSSFKQEVLDSKKTVLVDVWAPWCAPCRGMTPIIESIAEETKEWAVVAKINAEIEKELTQELGVSGLPTFLVFKDGKVVKNSVGATSKSSLLRMME